jgi:hypothetical protein
VKWVKTWPATSALLCLAVLAFAHPLLLVPLAVFVAVLWVVDRR